MDPARSRLPVRLLATLLFFTTLAGQFWRNLFGWWGFGVLAILLVAASVAAVVVLRPEWRWRRVPKSLLAFVGLGIVSIAWSAYPAASALGAALQIAPTVAAAFLGLCLGWREVLRTLGVALRWILGLSLAFELWVAVVIGEPLLPNFVDYGDEKVPMAFYWSRALLFDGGPIEGIVASRNLLGFVALIALIVFGIQLAAATVKRGSGIAWIVVAVLTLALTRSATVALVAVAVALALAFALWARRAGPDHRARVYLSAAGVLAASVTLLIAGWDRLLDVFGKGDDLTGRLDIWEKVVGLAAERPVFGWGWVGYWNPFVEPFDDLAVRRGVTYLQAHNAWLDVWLQLGVLGLILFGSIVLSVLWRSWFLAVDRPRRGLDANEPFSATSLLPLLLAVALVAQSLAESRILIEGGWLLLATLAFLTKRRQFDREDMP